MLNDPEITKAVSRILQRSEKQIEEEKLLKIYVDFGIISQLDNTNNQIFYGRRGTGKTHVMKVLETELKSNDNVVLYIDGRTLGSTAQFSDTSVPLRNRCLSLFRDILQPIYNVLLEYIVDNPNENAEQSLQAADDLLSSISEPVKTYSEKEVTKEHSAMDNSGLKTGLLVGKNPKGHLSYEDSNTQSSSTKVNYIVSAEDKVVFPSLYNSLSKVLKLMNVHLYILFDEWSSFPRDIQPYLAEFIKRGTLPVPEAVVKIASLEYRTSFSQHIENEIIGFELGADISTSSDIDDYYVFDRNPEQITSLYSEMLYRHILIDLPDDYLDCVN